MNGNVFGSYKGYVDRKLVGRYLGNRTELLMKFSVDAAYGFIDGEELGMTYDRDVVIKGTYVVSEVEVRNGLLRFSKGGTDEET